MLGQSDFPGVALGSGQMRYLVFKIKLSNLVFANCWLVKFKIDSGLTGLSVKIFNNIAVGIVSNNVLNLTVFKVDLIFPGVDLGVVVFKTGLLVDKGVSLLVDLIADLVSGGEVSGGLKGRIGQGKENKKNKDGHE